MSFIKQFPDCADLNYKAACLCDRYRTEAEAIPFYIRSLALGLDKAQLPGAYLGFASTYRSLGKYEEAKEIFEKAILEFPEYRPFYTFLALTEFNLGQPDKAMKLLLDQLIETTGDVEILSYKRALDFYSTRLNEILNNLRSIFQKGNLVLTRFSLGISLSSKDFLLRPGTTCALVSLR